MEGRSTPPVSQSFLLLVLTATLGALLAPLNSTMIAVALPDIRADFEISRTEVTWLVSAYLIAMTVAMPLGGRIGDALGRTATFRTGLIAFLVLSVAAVFAPTFESLVVIRTLQAFFGAAVIPNGMAMLRSMAPNRLGEANGLVGAAIGLSAALGPVLGAVLLEVGSWRLIFLVNLPLVAGALLCLALLGDVGRPERSSLRLDWLGAAAFAGALVCFTYLLNGAGAAPAGFLVAAILAVGLGAVFVRQQRVAAQPLAGWHLFRTPSFAAGTVYVLLTNLVMYSLLLAVPFLLKELQGHSDAASGAALGAMALLMILLAPAIGRFSDRNGRRIPAVAGGVLMTVAASLLFVFADAGLIVLAALLAVFGLGMGLGLGPATSAAIEAAPAREAGIASGTVSMMRYSGSIIGAGLLGLLLGDEATPGIEVFRVLFGAVAVTSALTIVCAGRLHDVIGSAAEGNQGLKRLS